MQSQQRGIAVFEIKSNGDVSDERVWILSICGLGQRLFRLQKAPIALKSPLLANVFTLPTYMDLSL